MFIIFHVVFKEFLKKKNQNKEAGSTQISANCDMTSLTRSISVSEGWVFVFLKEKKTDKSS